ncbi:MAG TPA: RecT family recombinase [Ramlibacter sp.]|nr:RecT family recombinase [Ramlibacter sp.]
MNAPSQPESTALALASASAGSLLLHESSMERLERIADLMASGKTTVPAHLRGSKGDCFAITLQSMQWGMNPFAVAQKTHLVNGVLGYEAQLVSAVINSSGAVQDRFHFEWFGDWTKIVGKFKQVESRTKKDDEGNPKKFIVPDWKQEDEHGLGVRVWATLKGEKEPRVLELLMTQARTRNSTLWTEDPKQQIAYLAQKRWARLYAPDVILGVYTPDEIDEPGERFMGMADVVGAGGTGAAAAPASDPRNSSGLAAADSAEAFEKRIPIYRGYLAAGKTVDDIVQFIKSKRELTPEQEKRVRELTPAAQGGQVTDVHPKEHAAETGAPKASYPEIAERIAKATSTDQVDEACTLIPAILNEEHRAELTAKAEARRAELVEG